MSKTLEHYLVTAMAAGLIDHKMRALKGADGKVTFYVHPAGADGETLDFVVRGNSLVPNVTSESGDRMTFGQAIEALKEGKRVARAGWNGNGKGMWIALSPGSEALPAERFWSPHNRRHAEEHGPTDVLPCITMKTATGAILMGWLASQADMLAEDWQLVDGAEAMTE